MTDRTTPPRTSDPARGEPVTDLIAAALAAAAGPGSQGSDPGAVLAHVADLRTRDLVDGFVHQAGPPPGRFAWVALGSHARGELHCASDQDHALIWDTARSAGSSYAVELADAVITGLAEFGMRPCDGGYMADRWSVGLADWVSQARHRIEAPTPEAVLDTDIFLDLRRLAGDLDITPATQVLLTGAESPRLLHGLAVAATAFGTALNPLGRLPHGSVDLKRTGLAPIVLLARLYALEARSPRSAHGSGWPPRLPAACSPRSSSVDWPTASGRSPGCAWRRRSPRWPLDGRSRTWSSSTTSSRRTGWPSATPSEPCARRSQ